MSEMPGDGVSVGPCPRERLAEVLAVWAEAEAEPSATDDLGSLSQLVSFDPGRLLVASSGELLVGTLVAAWDGWRGGFYRLAVRPEWRRRGIAGRLVAHGEDRLRALGARRLAAIVVDDASGAADFWSSIGYQRQTARLRFVRPL